MTISKAVLVTVPIFDGLLEGLLLGTLLLVDSILTTEFGSFEKEKQNAEISDINIFFAVASKKV